jgi:hypothetical protein
MAGVKTAPQMYMHSAYPCSRRFELTREFEPFCSLCAQLDDTLEQVHIQNPALIDSSGLRSVHDTHRSTRARNRRRQSPQH